MDEQSSKSLEMHTPNWERYLGDDFYKLFKQNPSLNEYLKDYHYSSNSAYYSPFVMSESQFEKDVRKNIIYRFYFASRKPWLKPTFMSKTHGDTIQYAPVWDILK